MIAAPGPCVGLAHPGALEVAQRRQHMRLQAEHLVEDRLGGDRVTHDIDELVALVVTN